MAKAWDPVAVANAAAGAAAKAKVAAREAVEAEDAVRWAASIKTPGQQ